MSLITWTKAILLTGLAAAALSAQNPVCGPNYTAETTCNEFDQSANATLNGAYFVRMIDLGVGTSGKSLTNANSVSGIMTFDGAGTYTFTGQLLNSSSTTGATAVTCPSSTIAKCNYAVSANGLLVMQDPVFETVALQGEVGAAGPAAFEVNRPNGNLAFMVGIPVSASVHVLNGAYYGGYFDVYQANTGTVRQASFPFTANGNGGLGTLSVTGIGTDLGNAPAVQNLPGVTYSFASNVGTLTLGGSGAANFISGNQTFYVSNDGSIILGGTPGDYDIFVGIQALAGAASPASLQGIYFVGGFENDSSQANQNIFHALIGSSSATGTGVSINHREITRSDVAKPPFQDNTSVSTYAIPASGVFAADDNYQYALGANGTFLASGQHEMESLVFGMKAPAYTPTGAVWINPLGVVNAANAAPVTNPVAPNEIVSLYGQGMAPSAMYAPANVFPLPTMINNTEVYVNGSPAPLLYVSPGVIEMLSPSAWYPSNGWGYVTFQICQGAAADCAGGTGTYSNAVRVYAENSSPGVFDLTGSATGQGAILHANTTTLADANNPAHPGDIVSIFATGLGYTVNQPPIDGSEGIFSPITSAAFVYMGGVECDPLVGSNYFGLAPYSAGEYQINVTVPAGTPTGDVPVEVLLKSGGNDPDQSQTIETTINIQPAPAGASVRK